MTMTQRPIDFSDVLSERTTSIDVSGIRRVFELGAKLENPINLSIGQPDFPVPDPLKDAAIRAIQSDHNGYSLTQGTPTLRAAIAAHLRRDVGWDVDGDQLRSMVTSGTSGALLLAFMALLNPGDEAIIADPYFVIYPAHATMVGAKAVLCDTYPDFQITAERVEPLITDRTRLLLINSPGNPSGAVIPGDTLRDLVGLCEQRGIVLISDEIYDVFTYADALEDGKYPSPARFTDQMLLVRGFGKSYGCTGWRLGYAAGPRPLIEQMMKLQQYSFVCAPTPLQEAVAEAFDVDMSATIRQYEARRDRVMSALGAVTDLVSPGGAFYAFAAVPDHLGVSATTFAERAVERGLLVIPGAVFSARDTHIRISFAAEDAMLDRGLDILAEMMRP